MNSVTCNLVLSIYVSAKVLKSAEVFMSVAKFVGKISPPPRNPPLQYGMYRYHKQEGEKSIYHKLSSQKNISFSTLHTAHCTLHTAHCTFANWKAHLATHTGSQKRPNQRKQCLKYSSHRTKTTSTTSLSTTTAAASPPARGTAPSKYGTWTRTVNGRHPPNKDPNGRLT